MRTRRFTQDEIDLIQSIFGDELPESTLREYKINFRHRRPHKAMDHDGYRKEINVFGRRYYSEDYSRTKDAFNFGAMIHEATHGWQQFHKDEISGQKGYDYKLFRGCHLSDFGFEQQPSIIMDYALVYLFNGKASPYRTPDTNENRDLLKTVVEERFPKDPKVRERLAAEKRAQTEQAKLKFSFNHASGITAKLNDLCNETGSAFKYDIEVWKGGQGAYFYTNVERDGVAAGKNPMMTIWVDEAGKMGLVGERYTATEKNILDTITRGVRQKRLSKAPALSA